MYNHYNVTESMDTKYFIYLKITDCSIRVFYKVLLKVFAIEFFACTHLWYRFQ